MKKYIYIITTCVFLVACSYTNEHTITDNEIDTSLIELTEEEYISIAFDSIRGLSEESAYKILDDFIVAMQNSDNVKSTSSISIGEISKEVLSGSDFIDNKTKASVKKEIETSFYTFKITDGTDEGFAVVSGDERSPSLIAYVPKASDDGQKIPAAEIMMNHAKASHISDIMYIEHIRDSLRDKTLLKLGRLLGIPYKELNFESIKKRIVIIGEDLTRVTPVTTPPTRVYSFVNPLIYTKWGQNAPYNSGHPDIVKNLNTGATGKPYAGCVPVAIAQIFAYCEVPSFSAQGVTMDWDLLKSMPTLTSATSNIKEMVGKLMYEIYLNVNGEYNYENGIHSSTGARPSNYKPYINSIIDTEEDLIYNWDNVKNSLTALQPVIIHGQGHCWILDGYAICQKLIPGGSNRFDTYVTANLGWSAGGDGYYKLDEDNSITFNPNSTNVYDTDLNTIYVLTNCRNK